MRPDPQTPVVLAGATGHVGGALLERLVANGRRVRCIVRDPAKLRRREEELVEPIEGDLRERASLDEAFTEGCVAYFLVHSLAAGGSLADEERLLAENFAAAAGAAGAARLIYLGALVDGNDPNLSPHMASRLSVGRVFRHSGVQTIELRASIVIGAGSFSFELIRRLVDLLPVIVLPDWIDSLAQPIALADVLGYLLEAADIELEADAVVEIGGADQVTYRQLIDAYARATDARRLTIPVPVPGLATAAGAAEPLAGLLPGDARETLELFESLRHTTVVRDRSAQRFQIRPMNLEAALAAALEDD